MEREGLPFCIGHRGARQEAPENTLAGLREAARQGACWVEVDVTLSADGVPVILHDFTLERTTNGHGRVREWTFAALQALDAGGGEPVPALAAVLAEVRRLGLGLNLEIKPDPGREAATVWRVLAALRRVYPAPVRHRASAGLLLSSFSPRILSLLAAGAPGWRRGLLLCGLRSGWGRLARAGRVSSLHLPGSHVCAAGVRACRRHGWPVLVYTVNRPRLARCLRALGVTAIFTDCPGRMLAAVREPAFRIRPGSHFFPGRRKRAARQDRARSCGGSCRP